jgi:1-deoxy-D-xylulose-5-phosphate synthase
LGEERKDIVALTAAMLGPTGLDKFQEKYPQRTFDVGIAEQHATTSAAGMAFAGLHPVVAVYSTFLNRAFDQLLLDVALHKAGVTFVLDRAGITGDDGPSHHGIWDLALTGIVPTLRVAAPRDGARLRELLGEAVSVNDAPTLLRFPKGALSPELPAFERREGIDILYRGESPDILVVAIGAMAQLAVDAAAQAYREGVGVTVIDPRWVRPLPISALARMAERYSRIVVIEDGIKVGGISSSLSDSFRDLNLSTPIHSIGVPLVFIEHSKRNQILEDLGITSQSVARQLVSWFSGSVTQEVTRLPADENADRKPLR